MAFTVAESIDYLTNTIHIIKQLIAHAVYSCVLDVCHKRFPTENNIISKRKKSFSHYTQLNLLHQTRRCAI